MIQEQTFINGGEIYKEVRVYENQPYKIPYIFEDSEDPVTPFYKLVNGNKKIYKSTLEMRKFLGYENNSLPADTTSYNVCPEITLVVCTAEIENTSNKELYFRVDSSDSLKKISTYYSLPYPVCEEVSKLIDNNPGLISSYWSKDNEEIVLGSVKFQGNTPIMLKLYTLYKNHDKWELLNRGRVFENGSVIEEGGWYISRHLPSKFLSESKDTLVTHKRAENRKTIEPLATWESHIKDKTTGEVKVKYYESSKMVRLAICNMNSGSNYENYDKAPNVNWWLGRSWIEDTTEEELFFHVENKNMLDEVCSYYNLPVPYSSEIEETLVNNIRSIRFKSYDLLKLGQGKFIEVVAASVVFKDKQPVAIRLYETKRPNE